MSASPSSDQSAADSCSRRSAAGQKGDEFWNFQHHNHMTANHNDPDFSGSPISEAAPVSGAPGSGYSLTYHQETSKIKEWVRHRSAVS